MVQGMESVSKGEPIKFSPSIDDAQCMYGSSEEKKDAPNKEEL